MDPYEKAQKEDKERGTKEERQGEWSELKCPYNGFKDCIVEKCPSCNFKENKVKVLDGRKPIYMTEYEFISCKLIDNSVQPVPKTTIENHVTTKQSVLIRRSIF